MINIGDSKAHFYQVVQEKNFNIQQSVIFSPNTEFEDVYDIVKSSSLYAHISYDDSDLISFIDIDRPSSVIFEKYKTYANIFDEDFFDLYKKILQLDKNLYVDARGFISKEFMFGIHAPSFQCRYLKDEEDYPKGEEGWSGEIASVYFFNEIQFKKLYSLGIHDEKIKEQIDNHLKNKDK
jgi:hypothetical protein